MRLPKSYPILALTAVLTAATSGISLADDAKPFAGQSITVLMPSPQDANIAADFERPPASRSTCRRCRGTISGRSW